MLSLKIPVLLLMPSFLLMVITIYHFLCCYFPFVKLIKISIGTPGNTAVLSVGRTGGTGITIQLLILFFVSRAEYDMFCDGKDDYIVLVFFVLEIARIILLQICTDDQGLDFHCFRTLLLL